MSRGRGQDFRVTIASARNVRAADILGGKSDPYCVCEVVGRRNEKKQKTHTVNDTKDPKWNYTFELKNCTGVENLKFDVCDSDWGSADDPVGTATMAASLYFPEGFDGELELFDKKAKSAAFLKVRVVPVEGGSAPDSPARPSAQSPAGSPRPERPGGHSPAHSPRPGRYGGHAPPDGTHLLEGEPSRRPPRPHGIEHSLNEGVEQADKLEERARKLQEHFEQAQHCMSSINALCEEADACILKSQTTLNKTAKKIHDLTKRASSLNLGQDAHHVLQDFGEAVHQPEISSRRGKVGRSAGAAAPQLR